MATLYPAPEESSVVGVGQPAPNFTLTNTDGRVYTLHNLVQTQPLVLVFYRGDWCPYCQLQLAQLGQTYPQFTGRGAEVWAISPQSHQLNQQFREKRGVPFPILYDENTQIIRQWGLYHELNPYQLDIPYPTTYIIKVGGVVHWRKLGLRADDRPTPGEVLSNLP